MSNRHRDTVDGDSRAVRAAAKEEGKASDRSKKAMSHVFLVLRIVLFVLACVFAVFGVKGFIEVTDTQAASKLATMESAQGLPVRHALVLMSDDESNASVSRERDGVKSVLDPSGVTSDVFYMDARAGAALGGDALAASIVNKGAAAGGYDVIVASGDDALDFIMDNQSLFAGVPTAFFAVSDEALAQGAREQGVATGYFERGAAVTMLDAACKLLPHATRAIVLVDGTLEADGLLDQLDTRATSGLSAAPEVWDVSRMSRGKLGERLEALGADSFVLNLSANRDSTGNAYTPTATAYFLAEHAPVASFSAMGGVGEGMCGASFIDRSAEGADAAKLAIDLLNGTGVAAKPVVPVDVECTVFDAEALAAHGIDPDATPADAALVNESTFSWRAIRPLIQPLMFLIAAVVCIVGFGVIGFRRSVKSNQAIIASRNDLQYRLYHDLLTELPNRHALEKFAADPANERKLAAVAQVDIRDFTDINDSYGHAFGDDVIQIVAKRLAGVKSSFLVRSGGDVFTLVFPRKLAVDSPELRHIGRIFDDPVIVGNNKVDISATVGIANREEDMTGADLIVFSDMAVHDAKENNVRHPVFYDESMREVMDRKLRITEHLRQAISDESVNVLWQPQVDTATLAVVGYEALCRLEGDEYFPADFIPVAEKSGLVSPLDRIVTKKVVEQLGVWLKEGRDVGVASINFSAAQLRDKGYCDFLAEQLAINDVPASLVKMEITESMILDNEEDAARLFRRLRSMGVTLALDDFGTGYSSLYQMADRPIDVVKLDRSLVDAFMVPGKEGFIADIVQLVRGLDKKIVVEGVETLEQYSMCLDFGCDVIQGFLFARPMPADEVIVFDAAKKMADVRAASGDKTRNGDWHKYDRDEHGRWKKKAE